MRLIDADELIADCQLAQKQADRHGREFANAFYSGGGDISTEWWCVEDMIENAPTVDAVEVVRCKDCKYAHMTYAGECKYCDIWFPDEPAYADGTFYCAAGERRTDEQT